MDERPNGWPLQRNWEGVSMLDVILNKDRLIYFFIISFNKHFNLKNCIRCMYYICMYATHV